MATGTVCALEDHPSSVEGEDGGRLKGEATRGRGQSQDGVRTQVQTSALPLLPTPEPQSKPPSPPPPPFPLDPASNLFPAEPFASDNYICFSLHLIIICLLAGALPHT